MKRRLSVMAMIVVLCFILVFNSCIGSFILSRKVLSWNQSVGDKWVNELVFLVLCSIPVYEIAWALDAVILNTIEFWSGENPALSNVKMKQLRTENGVITITSNTKGYTLQKEGYDETMKFTFDQETDSWLLEAMGGQSTQLLQFIGNNQAKVYLADGSTMTVSIDRNGVLALRRMLEYGTYFAHK